MYREVFMSDSKNTGGIKSELEYQKAAQTLSKQNQPPSVLRFLMRALETYRSNRKMGWSRPWNKYDLLNFQSLKLKLPDDNYLIEQAKAVLSAECQDMPVEQAEFARELLADPNLMCFVFAHEFTDDVRQFEGATLSFGRANNKRYRDRLDIIVESEVMNGISKGFTRARIFVDPYVQNESHLWSHINETLAKQVTLDLFYTLSNLSWSAADDVSRQWNHWTSAYIDYFGPRQWPMKHSYFFTPGTARIFRDARGASPVFVENEQIKNQC